MTVPRPVPIAASTCGWDSTLSDHLATVTLVGPLDHNLRAQTIDVVRRYGFAIIDSIPCAHDPESIAARSAELLEFGRSLGTPLVQSRRNELVEDVKDYSDIETGVDRDLRGYRSGGEMVAHSDPPTLVVLHCICSAREGGESSIVSVESIVNRMDAESPGLAQELFTPLPDWRVAGQQGDDAGPAPARPVLARHDGVLSCVLYRPHIEWGAAATGTELTSRQIAALDLFERHSMDDGLTLRLMLQPGQTLVVHNRSVLHARSNYRDWPELHRRRHLLRLWIDAPGALPVHPSHQLGDIFAAG